MAVPKGPESDCLARRTPWDDRSFVGGGAGRSAMMPRWFTDLVESRFSFPSIQ